MYPSEDSMTSNNLTAICRLCLSVNSKFVQLFRSDEIETSAIPLSMKVSLCTAIRMSKQDILPKRICLDCLNYVSEWYKFRKKCIKNDAYLKRCLSGDASTKAQCNAMDNSSITSDNNKTITSAEFSNTDLKIHESDSVQSMQAGNSAGDNLGGLSLSLNNSSSSSCTTNCSTACIDGDNSNVTAIAATSLLKAPTKKFKCPACPDSFYYVKDLKLHKSVIHKSARYEKTIPEGKTSEKNEDVKLDELNARARYEMKCCEKIFFSKAKFRRHYVKKHPGEKPFMCETCGKRDFISEETLKRHKILHTGKYKCDVCGKTFTCNAILIIHKRDKHENDKPFVCDVCGKRFVTELLMNYHKRFHTGEKKYVCEECGLAVVTSSSLAKHKRIHSNIKPHVCQVCGKGFIIKGRLVEHLRVHTGERPYSCHICHKGFTMRDKLKRHIRIHSGEKLFSCEYCGNNYSTSYGLTIHLKSHIVRNY